MGVEIVETDGVLVKFGGDILHLEEVLQGLGHLDGLSVGALGLQHTVVHPVVGELASAGCLGLRDLVLVVGEDQVVPSAVDVDGVAEIMPDHGRALDVPAGPSLAPGRVPEDLSGLDSFPYGEVEGILLVGIEIDTSGGPHLLDGAVGQCTEVGDLPDPEVNAAVRGGVSVALVDDVLDHVDDVRHAGARLRVDVSFPHSELGDVLEVLLDVIGGQLQRIDASLVGTVDDLVVDIGEIGDVGDVVSEVLEVAPHDIEGDDAPGVAHVDVVVYGDTADVHLDLPLLDRDEFLFLVG